MSAYPFMSPTIRMMSRGCDSGASLQISAKEGVELFRKNVFGANGYYEMCCSDETLKEAIQSCSNHDKRNEGDRLDKIDNSILREYEAA